jgi:DNA-binding transcriptional MerR regulator
MTRTGITARQLQWWDEQGIVVPAREGHRRLYSLDDLVEVAVICDLRRRGFSLQRVRKVIRLLQKEFKKRLVDTVSGYSAYHLLTDGNRIYLKNSAEQVIDLLKNSRQPMLAVCLSDTVRQVQGDMAKPPLQLVERELKPAVNRKTPGRAGIRAKRAAI